MANYTVYPNSDGLTNLHAVLYPTPYTGANGQGRYENLQEVSAEKITPLIRSVSTAQFISGNYTSFLAPLSPMPARTLPCFETTTTILADDTFKIYNPHKGYIIGSDSDPLTGSFAVNVYAGEYTSDGEVIPAMSAGQVLKIVIYKEVGATIDWDSSNIDNNYLDDKYISPATRIEFNVQKLNTETYQIVSWVTPDITSRQVDTDRLTDLAVTAAKLAVGAALANVGIGGVSAAYLAAGAALANLAPASVGSDKLVAGTALANIGLGNILPDYLAAGAALANIVDRSISGIKLANEAVDTPQIKNAAVTGDKIMERTIVANNIQLGALPSSVLTATAALDNIGSGGINTSYIANGAVTNNKLDKLATGIFSASFTLHSFGTPYTNWSMGEVHTSIVGVIIGVDSSSANSANVTLTFPAAFGLANRGYVKLSLAATAVINGTSWFRSMATAANIRATSTTKLYVGIGDVAIVGERSGSSLSLTQMTGSPAGAAAQVNICISFPYI